MAFSLPKYQRQVAPSKETGAVRGDVGSAGAQWGAVANFADTVGGAVQGFAKIDADRKAKKDNLSLIRANDIISTAEAEGKNKIKLMTDDAEIALFKQSWQEELDKRLSEIDGGKQLLQRLDVEKRGAIERFGVNANYEMSRAIMDAEDLEYIKIQQKALDGGWAMHPETGMHMNPEEAYAWATDQRVSNNKLDFEDGAKAKRNFAQDLTTRTIVAASDNSITEAEELFKKSKLTGDNLVIASDAIRDAKESQKRAVESDHRRSEDDLLKLHNSKQLTRGMIRQFSEETVNRYGEDFPKYDPSVLRTYETILDASVDEDLSRWSDSIPKLKEAIGKMANAGRIDMGEKEPVKVYNDIRLIAKAGASRATGELLLGQANSALQAYADGRGWSKESADELNYIADAYSTVFTEMPTKYKDAAPIASITKKIGSFIKLIEDNGGNPSSSVIAEWEDENGITKLREDVALNDMMKRYEVRD